MRSRYLVFVAVWLALIGLAMVPGRAADTQLPDDEAGFTAALADKFRAAVPQATVRIDGPLSLVIDVPGKPPAGHTYLDRMWKFCRNNAEQCIGVVDEFVRRMAATMTEITPPPEPAAIRLVVRPTRDIDTTLDQMRHAGGDKPLPIVGQLAGEFSWMLVFDLPEAVHTINAHDLAKLGLTQDQAYARGLSNLAGELRPFASVAPLPAGGRIGVIRGNFYESSRLLLHDAWKDLAGKMVGPLLVAAPGADIVLYGDGGWPTIQADLAEAAQRAAKQNEKPLAIQLLKWTPVGWEPVVP